MSEEEIVGILHMMQEQLDRIERLLMSRTLYQKEPNDE
jgi:hypothetical protein